jgi:plasmid stabilization system protein ParE
MVKQQVYKLVWDRQAIDHLKNILSYLSKQSEQAPQIVKSAIFDRLEIIQKNPQTYEIDKLKNIPNTNFRAFVVFSYRITYQISSINKEIRILRVMHTSRVSLGY